MTIKFQDLERVTDKDIEAAVVRNDPRELYLLPVTLALICTDPKHAQSICLQLSSHANGRVRGNALISLGHLARRFRDLEERTVRPVIETALNDRNEYVRIHAKSAADEMCQFLGWTITGHEFGS
jgi:hypothetical protein